ncbi:MAG TPA: EthD domain-containing protein [Sphingobium sp.]|nr:EthD domain-containing protein [Sphingobium sp.]
MPQIVMLLKRKPGMTMEEFKAHYESSHAQMALRYQGHLMQDYRRNYVQTQFGLDEFGKSTGEPAYDAITVISFASDAELEEFMKAGKPFTEEFIADEYRFLDRDKVLGFITEQEVSPLPRA